MHKALCDKARYLPVIDRRHVLALSASFLQRLQKNTQRALAVGRVVTSTPTLGFCPAKNVKYQRECGRGRASLTLPDGPDKPEDILNRELCNRDTADGRDDVSFEIGDRNRLTAGIGIPVAGTGALFNKLPAAILHGMQFREALCLPGTLRLQLPSGGITLFLCRIFP